MALFGTGRTMFYKGCVNIGNSEKYDSVGLAYEKILDKLSIKCPEVANFLCGTMLLNLGYEKDFIKLARKNLSTLKEMKITKIITSCPECFKTLSQDYPRFLHDFDIKIDFVLTPILEKLRSKKIKTIIEEPNVTYQDPCFIGRYGGIYDVPRDILNILGYSLIEMKHNRKEAFCCGAGGALDVTNKNAADEGAKIRLEHAKSTRAAALVTACPLCYSHFHMNKDNNPIGMQIKDISELIAEALKIKIK